MQNIAMMTSVYISSSTLMDILSTVGTYCYLSLAACDPLFCSIKFPCVANLMLSHRLSLKKTKISTIPLFFQIRLGDEA
jgi:hypothetical protein